MTTSDGTTNHVSDWTWNTVIYFTNDKAEGDWYNLNSFLNQVHRQTMDIQQRKTKQQELS